MTTECKRAVTQQTKHVLIPLNHEAFALNQLCLYEEMRGKVNWRPILLNTIGRRFDAIVAERGYSIIPDYISPPTISGYEHVSNVDDSEVRLGHHTNRRRFKNLLKNLLGSRLVSMLVPIYIRVKLPYDVFRLVGKYNRQINYLCGLIRKEGICAIVLAETSPAYGAVVFKEAARRCDIVLVANTYGKDSPANYADIFSEDPARRCNRIENIILAFLFPQWVYKLNGKLLRLPAAEIAAQEILKISPPKPWSTRGELEDAFCVESMSDFDFHKKLEVNEDKMFSTGTGRLDRLARNMRSRETIKKSVLGEVGFDSDREIILCLLPQTHWVTGRSVAEFQSHSEMLQVWIEALMAQDKFNVIVSLHPSMQYDKFKYLETDRIRISRRSVFDLISVCSIFISSGSTTTPLAIAAGLPVVTYDPYRSYHVVSDPEFFSTKRVITVFNGRDFRDVIVKISTDQEFLENMRHRDEKEAEYFGILDGGSVERVLSVIDKLVGSKDKEPSEDDVSWSVRWNTALVSLHAKLFDTNGDLRPEFSQHTACPVCGSGDSREYCVKDQFRYRTCCACGMVYMNPRLNTQATLAFYNCPANEIYNEAKFHAAPAGTSSDDEINRENAQLIAKHIGKQGQVEKLKGKRVLEIGCAKGYFLSCAKKLGAETFGIELNQRNVEIARRSLAGTIYDRDLFELRLPSESFDVIYTRDVIEHIHKPGPFLKELHRLMKPGAMAFIETHNIDGWIHRIVGGKHTCIFGFEHPVHWSPKTLSLALGKSGLVTRNVYFGSRDFTILDILQYYIQPTFTTIFPWKASKPIELLLKAASIPFRLPGIRNMDSWLMPRLANCLSAGSTMKVIAFKPRAAARGGP